MKIKAFTPSRTSGDHVLVWEKTIDDAWHEYKEGWYKSALTKPMNALNSDERYIRIDFNDACDRDGLSQGDILCVGNKQCYII